MTPLPDFMADIVLYPSDKGGRHHHMVGTQKWFSCPCKFNEKDYTAWDCRIFLQGDFHPGETQRLGIKFLSPEIASAFRSVNKFYLWECRIIGEAHAVPDTEIRTEPNSN